MVGQTRPAVVMRLRIELRVDQRVGQRDAGRFLSGKRTPQANKRHRRGRMEIRGCSPEGQDVRQIEIDLGRGAG